MSPRAQTIDEGIEVVLAFFKKNSAKTEIFLLRLDSGVIIASDIFSMRDKLRWISRISKEGMMLVLTRGIQQKIEIGNRMVTVTVLDVKGGRVRLGIEASDDISIRRQELIEAGSPTVITACVN